MSFLLVPENIGRRKSAFECTGGTETTVGTNRVHTFLSSGTFTVVAGEGDIDLLVVAGGGASGGASVVYSGGGAGGYVSVRQGGGGGSYSSSSTNLYNSNNLGWVGNDTHGKLIITKI